jgi:hypothetical protein
MKQWKKENKGVTNQQQDASSPKSNAKCNAPLNHQDGDPFFLNEFLDVYSFPFYYLYSY